MERTVVVETTMGATCGSTAHCVSGAHCASGYNEEWVYCVSGVHCVSEKHGGAHHLGVRGAVLDVHHDHLS